MKTIKKAVVVLGLLVALTSCAMAQTSITWNFNDVVFTYLGNQTTVTGWFITDLTGNSVLSYSITMTGANAFTVTTFVDQNFVPDVGFASSGFSQFVALYLSSPMTSAGGLIPIVGGFNCPGCGVLLLANDGHNPSIFGIVPEPSALLNLDLIGSLGLVGFVILRRKIMV